MAVDSKVTPRLFQVYTIEDLAEKTGYSVAYLTDLRNQPKRIRPRFKRVVAIALRKTEAELFGAP